MATCRSCGVAFAANHRCKYYCSKTCRQAPLDVRLRRNTAQSEGDGCWLWQGSRNNDGYGEIGHNRKVIKTHRAAYALANSPIPNGACVLHRCDNPPCVNPGHLFLGTNTDNMADMVHKRRHAFGERHRSAKLTPEKVRAIRWSAETSREAARRYGVTSVAINQVRNLKTWRHVE